jgi:hypothetical protein
MNTMHTKRFLILVVGLGLTGCVTTTEPVKAGKDQWLITTNARGGFSSNGKLLADTVERANAFCARQGLVAEVQSTHTDGTQGWTPQGNDVLFKCVPREK